MKSVRAAIGMVCLSVLVMSVFSACGKKESAEGEKGSADLVFWHWWTDRQPVLEQLAKKYKEQTGVSVRFQVAAPVGSEYNNKLQAAAQANTLPDIVGIAAGGELLARYINAGKIYELTDDMNAGWKNEFFSRAAQDFGYKAGNQYGVKPDSYWGVPISAMAIQIFYNKDLFKQAGLDPEKPPKTWKEFIAAGQKLKEKNIIPLSIGFGDLWMIGAFLEPYAWSYVGEQNMKATILGKRPYTTAEWEKVLKLFVDLRDNQMLVKGGVTSPNKESEQLFSSGRCAMIMNGSWGVNVFKGMNPGLNYGVMRLPKPDDAAYPMYVRGGVGSGAAVTTQSPRAKDAVAFLKWLTSQEQQTVYANVGLDLPANQKCLPGLLPQLQPFASSMNDLIPDIQVSEKYEVQEALWKGIQTIFISDVSPKDILKNVQAAKEKSLKGI
jgi:ABC-type glycerol-3-phosphate transport system substrate-binding protein